MSGNTYSTQTVYGIFIDDPEPTCIYIGTTTRDIDERLKEHKRYAKRPDTTKPLYFYIRQNQLLDRIYIVALDQRHDAECDPDEEQEWEDWWLEQFLRLRHPLQNARRGNKKMTVKKKTINDLYKQINKAVEERLEA